MAARHISFRVFQSPSGHVSRVPADIELKIPADSTIDRSLLNFLVFIPWNARYLENVPTGYREFFEYVLPLLAPRTTNVHVALCLPFIKKLGEIVGSDFDERIVYIAFILHDIGWSQLSEQEIASSLGVKGLILNPKASKPKEKHAKAGKVMAKQILGSYEFAPPLTTAQKTLICDAVEYHDKPWELSRGKGIPLEMKLVCDVDHLWSFTHQNFWQDTVRKNVDPKEYLNSLCSDLDDYFITRQAKDLAKCMLSLRETEVDNLHKPTA